MSEFPRFEPPASEVALPYWDATRERRLLVQWCLDCERPIFYPREVCPFCLGVRLEWREASGGGTVYAVTVEHRPQNPKMAERAPYAVALVDLDEGVRMLTSIVGTDPLAVRVGDRVRVAWEALSDGRHLPVFEPAD